MACQAHAEHFIKGYVIDICLHLCTKWYTCLVPTLPEKPLLSLSTMLFSPIVKQKTSFLLTTYYWHTSLAYFIMIK
jgi:hypothetical protein